MHRLAPLVLLMLCHPALAEWSDDQPELLVNQLSVAIALKAHDVELDTASALVANTGAGQLIKRYDRWHGREHLVTTEATTVALMTLDDHATPGKPQTWRIEAGEICTQISGQGVPVTHTQLTALSPFEPASSGEGAQLFRASGEQGEEVFTWLQPGETVTMVQAESHDKKRRVEHIELRQRERRLTITRDEAGSEACYVPE